MDYPRMMYPSEQREWVRVADEKLPTMRSDAAHAQQKAAELFDALHKVAPASRKYWLDMTSEAYGEAIMLLNRVLYYEGMRRANLPRGEDND